MPVCSVWAAKAQMGTDSQVWFNGNRERQDRDVQPADLQKSGGGGK